MTTAELDKLRYPVGKFAKPDVYTKETIEKYIQTIAEFPDKLKAEVLHLNDEQLDTPYRPGGWTIRQVVHHCADSHMNSVMRFKLALTEDVPAIKPYFEEHWAELADSKNEPIAPSIKIIEGLHERWVVLLRSLTPQDLDLNFFHPEKGKEVSLKETMAVYHWHCEHHLAHITQLKKSKNWK